MLLAALDLADLIRRRSLVSIALAALLGASAPVAGGSLENGRIVDELGILVFGSEFQGQESSVVHKWMGPMRVAVYAERPGRHSEVVARHLARLRILTGLDAALVDSDDESRNAHILFLDRAEYESHVRKRLAGAKNAADRVPVCFGMFRLGPRGEISRFLALIPEDLSATLIRACIVEETTQMLGLPNDLPRGHASVFNDDGRFSDLTPRDELYLRVLYDPRIELGMSRPEFARAALAVLKDIVPNAAAAVPARDGPSALAATLAPEASDR